MCVAVYVTQQNLPHPPPNHVWFISLITIQYSWTKIDFHNMLRNIHRSVIFSSDKEFTSLQFLAALAEGQEAIIMAFVSIVGPSGHLFVRECIRKLFL